MAAKSLDCTRKSLYDWIEQEGLQQAVIEGRNARLDFAESKLDERMQKGDTTALIFFLKTQGRDRGYIDHVVNEHTGDVKITVVYAEEPNSKA